MKLKFILAMGLLFAAMLSCKKENLTATVNNPKVTSQNSTTENSILDYYSCGSSTTTILRTVASTTSSGGSCGGSSSNGGSSTSGSSCGGSSYGGSSSGGSSTSTPVDCGVVVISNNYEFIEVKINTTGNWILNKTRIYIGNTSGVPTNTNGTPKISMFPYITTHPWDTESYTLRIPKGTLTGNIIVAVEADVLRVNKTTGAILENRVSWGVGTNFISSDPSQKINYNIKNCVEV